MGRMSHGGLETDGPDSARLQGGGVDQDPGADRWATEAIDDAPLPEIEGLTITERLAPDAGGQRYLATDLRSGQPIGVRLCPLPADATDRARLVASASSLGPLSAQPGIVTVFQAGIIGDDDLYLVTERPEPTMADWLSRQGPLPWPQAADLILQTATTVGQMHQTGLRVDLRPETLALVGAEAKLGELSLLDLGHQPATVETLVHRAPEAVAGGGDARSDLYSLTSILFQLIDGRAPHWRPGDSADALRGRIVGQPPAPLDPELVPPPLRVFVAAGLSADPLDRPQTVTEFNRELELIRHGRTTGPTESVLHATTSRTPLVVDTSPDLAAYDRPGPGPAATVAPMMATASDYGGPAADLGPNSSYPPPIGGGGYDATAAMPTSDVRIPLLEPTGDRRGAEPRPITSSPPVLIGMGLVALAILGLVGALALGVFSGDEPTATAPALPDPDAGTETASAGEASEQGSTPTSEATPLAMLETTTTTEREPESFTTTSTTVQRVVVPNLVGLDVTTAGQTLDDAGFDVLVVGRVAPGSPPGTVIQQTPAAGSAVTLPITITLFIPRSASLPQMVGRPASTVCLELQALGVVCSQQQRFDDQVPIGFVISTDPIEGTGFQEGDTVTVQVSKGPALDVAIPDVAGSTEQAARTALTEAGFVDIATTSVASETVPAGTVIGTDPAAGTTLGQDQTVTLQISSGPPAMVVVPDVVGLTQAAAETALSDLGLSPAVATTEVAADDPTIGQVVSASPAAGAEVAPGSTVTITVAVAPEG